MAAFQFALLSFFIFLFSTKIFASSEDLGIDENKDNNIINSNNNNNNNDVINNLNRTLKNERAGKSKQIIDDSFFYVNL
jgi:hypothetical protein